MIELSDFWQELRERTEGMQLLAPEHIEISPRQDDILVGGFNDFGWLFWVVVPRSALPDGAADSEEIKRFFVEKMTVRVSWPE